MTWITVGVVSLAVVVVAQGLLIWKLFKLLRTQYRTHQQLEQRYVNRAAAAKTAKAAAGLLPEPRKHTSYETWLHRHGSMFMRERLDDRSLGPVEATTLKMLNELLFEHDCGDKNLLYYEDPENRCFGWSCNCRLNFEMKLSDMKMDMAWVPKDKQEAIKRMLGTAEGRQELGRLLMQQDHQLRERTKQTYEGSDSWVDYIE